jgi:hypothetical protein
MTLEQLEPRQFLSVSLQNGWTVVTPESGAKVIYVSNSGSDSNPGTQSRPVRSIKKAHSMMSNGRGDQMLLERGDVWKEPLGHWAISGRSSSQPAVIGAYGSGERPRIEATTPFYVYGKNTVHDVVIQGLAFKGPGGQDGFRVLGGIDNLLIEDVKVERFRNNIILQRGPARVTDVTIRRSIIVDAVAKGGHAEGLYADGVENLKLEENTFDGNGWGSGANALSHNAYITSNTSGFVARGNTFANAAGHGLQARSGGTIENNLFYNNTVGMSFGVVHGDGPTKAGGVSGRIANNVFSGADNRSSSRTVIGLEITNTNKSGTTVENNLFVNGHPTRKDAALSLTVGSSRVNGGSAVGINSLTIRGNVVKGWNKVFGIDSKLHSGGSGPTALNGLNVTGNSFSSSSGGGRSVTAGGSARTVNSGFISRARSQSRSSWSSTYTGGSAVSAIKSGSGVSTNIVASPSSSGGSSSSSSSGPSVSINDISGTEVDSGTSRFTFTVRLSSKSSHTVSVRWETKGQSALVGRDYVGRNGTLTFKPGETSHTISIEVKGDRTRESDEKFVVNLLGATNGRISDSQGVATVRNDD